jgi:hypothetical protein
VSHSANASGPAPRGSGEESASLGEALLLFAPLHKRAFGMAIGVASGMLVFVVTAFSTLFPENRTWPLSLLSEYFAGYTVSWEGAFLGGAWGWFVGFVAGWFAAFCRNLFVALELWLGRTKEELAATRDFLDHI